MTVTDMLCALCGTWSVAELFLHNVPLPVRVRLYSDGERWVPLCSHHGAQLERGEMQKEWTTETMKEQRDQCSDVPMGRLLDTGEKMTLATEVRPMLAILINAASHAVDAAAHEVGGNESTHARLTAIAQELRCIGDAFGRNERAQG